jgi:outer membrane lipoprotein-sorting protein
MGRFFLTIAFFLYSLLGANPVNPESGEVLEKMASALKANKAMELKFQMTAVDEDGSVEGSFSGVVQAQGYAFKLMNPELEVFCDGVSKWILNVGEGELTIFANDTTQVDLVENPVGFLSSLNSSNSQFKQPSKAQLTKNPLNGREIWSVELTPKSRYAAYKSLTVCIDKESFLPSVLMYRSNDGNSYTITIESIKPTPVWPLSFFQFPAERTNNLNITDLR